MKVAIVFLMMVLSMQAHAAYKIGDKATFDVEILTPNMPVQHTLYSLEIIDVNNDKYKVREILGTHVYEYLATESALIFGSMAFPEAYVDEFLKKCDRPNWEFLETISNALGTFDACTMYLTYGGPSSVSAAKGIPFGIVKKVIGPASDGTFNNYSLKEIQFGH